MNQPTVMPPEDQSLVDLSQSPGQRLRLQRESRGLEIERVASQLHLRPQVVEFLEQDRYDSLPDPVFVAGYLRNYARLLGLDPIPIVNAYRKAASIPEIQTTATLSGRPSPGGSSGGLWVRLLSLGLVGVALGMALLWWLEPYNLGPTAAQDAATAQLDQGQSATEPEWELPDTTGTGPSPVSDTLAQAPQSLAPEPSLKQAPDEPPSPETRTPSGVASLEAESPAPRPDPASSVLPELAASATAPVTDSTVSQPVSGTLPVQTPEMVAAPEPSGAPEVAIEFTGTCWVDVRAADGSVVLNGEMRDGDRHLLTGEPPYKFVIGNALATRVMVEGRPFDVIGRSRGNVARFTLDPTAPQ